MMKSPEVILIAGPLAVGKSTLAAHLREALTPCAYVPVDSIRRMVSDQGLTDRHLRQAKTIACRIAECYLTYGYTVVIDSLFSERKYVELMAREISPLSCPMHLINLEADLPTLRSRDQLKKEPNFERVEEVFAHWRSVRSRLGAVLNTGALLPAEVCQRALALIRSNAARLDRAALLRTTS